MRSTKSGHESMQLRVRQSLQRTVPVGQPSHALPTRPQPRYLAHLTASFALGFLAGSLTVLLFLSSRVTVDGLTPTSLAMERAESPAAMPASIRSLVSLVMCFPFAFMVITSLPPAGRHTEPYSPDWMGNTRGRVRDTMLSLGKSLFRMERSPS
jgi:hypothetical protein